MLSLIISLPLITILLILLIPENYKSLIKQLAFSGSFGTFISSLFLWLYFDHSTSKFQFIEYFEWIPSYNLHFFLGVDGISLFFIILSTFLVAVCILNSWSSINKYLKEYMICFLLMDSFLVIVFSILDVVVFYIFFESILIPMFLIIGIWGSRTRKVKAAYQFFLYTLIGSLFMLLAIFLASFEASARDSVPACIFLMSAARYGLYVLKESP